MAKDASNKPKAGFQGSETSWAEVIVYSHGGDRILAKSQGAQEMSGSYRTDKTHTLAGVSTNKTLEAAGTWQATIKPSRDGSDTILDQIVDDDWVDIVFWRHGKQWHTMRGLVDDVRRSRAVSKSGATSYVYTITGRDFQKVFEVTPIWFNRFSRKIENIGGAIQIEVFSGVPNLSKDPLTTIQGFLLKFYEKLAGFGRANWEIPEMVPNTKGTFYDDILIGWCNEGFSGVPKRKGIDPNFGNPNGNLWELAKSWADPAFLELFCDLGKKANLLKANEELPLAESTISVVFRDKPFVLGPNLKDDQGNKPSGELGLGNQSAWFKLPLHIVPRQQIVSDDIGRSGGERLNAFFVSPQVGMRLVKAAALDLSAPLWDPEDIRKHGMRRYDIMTKYLPDVESLIGMNTIQRDMIRDWYALNPYFLNGTISLAIGRPDIHVGTRVRIPGDNEKTNQDDETYYVEQVSHSWKFGPGLKTQLGVTRGWRGNDASLLKAVTDLGDRYETSVDIAPGTQPQGG